MQALLIVITACGFVVYAVGMVFHFDLHGLQLSCSARVPVIGSVIVGIGMALLGVPLFFVVIAAGLLLGSVWLMNMFKRWDNRRKDLIASARAKMPLAEQPGEVEATKVSNVEAIVGDMDWGSAGRRMARRG